MDIKKEYEEYARQFGILVRFEDWAWYNRKINLISCMLRQTVGKNLNNKDK